MKKYSFAFCFLSLALPFCKKQNTDEVNKLDIITTGIWRVTEHTVYSITGTTDVYSTYPDCRKDNFLQFRKDGTLEVNEGPSKCNSGDPQSQLSPWKFLNNDTRIIIAGVEFVVDELDNNYFSVHTPRSDPYAPQTVLSYGR